MLLTSIIKQTVRFSIHSIVIIAIMSGSSYNKPIVINEEEDEDPPAANMDAFVNNKNLPKTQVTRKKHPSANSIKMEDNVESVKRLITYKSKLKSPTIVPERKKQCTDARVSAVMISPPKPYRELQADNRKLETDIKKLTADNKELTADNKELAATKEELVARITTLESLLAKRKRNNESNSNDDDDLSDDDEKGNNADPWSIRYNQLRQYVVRNGNCKVPMIYKPNPPLGLWVKNQRQLYKNAKTGKGTKLSEERISKLNSIGFFWGKNYADESHESFDAIFETNLSELKQHKETFGNFSKVHPNQELGIWITRLRAEYKLFLKGQTSLITLGHIQKLKQIGFSWKRQTAVASRK